MNWADATVSRSLIPDLQTSYVRFEPNRFILRNASMKKLAIFLLLLVLSQGCLDRQTARNAFYVSPTGNDSWSGSLKQPAREGNDGPFLTLQRARQAIRDFKQKQAIPAHGITVWLRGGTYSLSESFVLGGDDSGREGRLIRWRAFPGEIVRLTEVDPRSRHYKKLHVRQGSL